MLRTMKMLGYGLWAKEGWWNLHLIWLMGMPLELIMSDMDANNQVSNSWIYHIKIKSFFLFLLYLSMLLWIESLCKYTSDQWESV